MKGTWKLGGNATNDSAEYVDAGTLATIASQPFISGTCDDQKKLFTTKAKDERVTDLEAKGVAWAARYTSHVTKMPHLITMMCVDGKTGGFVVRSEVSPPKENIATELEKMMLAMLTAQLPKS